MKVTDAIVDRVAFLAKLEFKGAQKNRIKEDLNEILEMCEKLNEVDTEGVEPLVFMSPEKNAFRDDEPKQEITKKEALKNAPEKDSDYFKVPKVFAR